MKESWPRIHGVKSVIYLSFVDWPQRPSSVLFLGGCNFRCFYCHNRPIADERLPDLDFREVMQKLMERKAIVRNVVISGGEPTHNHKRLLYLCRILKKNGFSVKVDTNLSRPQTLRELIEKELVDFISADVKAPLDEELYSLVVGKKVDLSPIVESLQILQESRIDFEIRTTADSKVIDAKAIERILSDLKRIGLKNFRYRVQEKRD